MTANDDLDEVIVSLDQVNVISTMAEQEPAHLDWLGWSANTALRYEYFEKFSPRKIFVLGSQMQPREYSASFSSYSRLDMHSLNFMQLLSHCAEGAAIVMSGCWEFTLSSWVEGIRQIYRAQARQETTALIQHQIDRWKDITSKAKPLEYFILSDFGARFHNAYHYAEESFKRILRSRLVPEPKKGAWSAAVLGLIPASEAQGRLLRIKKILTLEQSEWCAGLNGTRLFSEDFKKIFEDLDSVWVSLPTHGLFAGVYSYIKQFELKTETKLTAPSVHLGWHPIRDFIAFLGENGSSRLLIVMDSTENLQFIHVQEEGF